MRRYLAENDRGLPPHHFHKNPGPWGPKGPKIRDFGPLGPPWALISRGIPIVPGVDPIGMACPIGSGVDPLREFL